MNKDVKAFECRMCGHCCKGEGGIVMAAKDQRRLADHLGLPLEDFLSRYTRTCGGKVILITGDDDYCIFFRQGEGCHVHPGRPDICRAWPFFKGNIVDAMSWEMIQEYCPGVRAEAGHDEFRRQGIEYIKSLNIECDDNDAPEALTNIIPS